MKNVPRDRSSCRLSGSFLSGRVANMISGYRKQLCVAIRMIRKALLILCGIFVVLTVLAVGLGVMIGKGNKQGYYSVAVGKIALKLAEYSHGSSHPSVATRLNGLAGLYMRYGRYAEAEPIYKRSLEIREKALGPDHPYVASSINSTSNPCLRMSCTTPAICSLSMTDSWMASPSC